MKMRANFVELGRRRKGKKASGEMVDACEIATQGILDPHAWYKLKNRHMRIKQ
jgi:hypothetical protein